MEQKEPDPFIEPIRYERVNRIKKSPLWCSRCNPYLKGQDEYDAGIATHSANIPWNSVQPFDQVFSETQGMWMPVWSVLYHPVNGFEIIIRDVDSREKLQISFHRPSEFVDWKRVSFVVTCCTQKYNTVL